MKIAVIGAGNGGQAIAGHLSIMGHEVRLYDRDKKKIAFIRASGEILLNDRINGVGRINVVTDDLAQVIPKSELIMIVTTADAHRSLALSMAKHMEDGQVIVLNPGRTLGAIEFSQILRYQCFKRVYIAEAQSLIFACRAEEPGNVRIIGIKDKVMLAAYPSSDTDHVLKILHRLYPCFEKTESVLKTSLENIGAMFHPTVILFNAAAIERGDLFYFYNDMTPAIADFLVQIDSERLNIGAAFGIDLISVTDWISYAYSNISGNTLCEKMRNNPAYYKILAPKTLYSRLLTEDVPTGILPLTELGKLAQVATPLMSSVFDISQALLRTDFRKTGRTLKNLGLEKISLHDLVKLVL